MRIVGGIFRSRKIEFPLDESIRPTRDMVREGIFSALGDIENRVVLDLFSGTGAYALEALSRGCKEAYLVDNSDIALKYIKTNVSTLKVESMCHILNMDYKTALERFKKSETKFDLIFIDPPYKLDIYEDTINYLINNKLLSETAIIVLEWNKEINLHFDYFSKEKKYKYKDNHILILRR